LPHTGEDVSVCDDDDDEMSEDMAMHEAFNDPTLDEDERLLQRMILRNFMARNRTNKLDDLKFDKINDGDDDSCSDFDLKKLSFLA